MARKACRLILAHVQDMEAGQHPMEYRDVSHGIEWQTLKKVSAVQQEAGDGIDTGLVSVAHLDESVLIALHKPAPSAVDLS